MADGDPSTELPEQTTPVVTEPRPLRARTAIPERSAGELAMSAASHFVCLLGATLTALGVYLGIDAHSSDEYFVGIGYFIWKALLIAGLPIWAFGVVIERTFESEGGSGWIAHAIGVVLRDVGILVLLAVAAFVVFVVPGLDTTRANYSTLPLGLVTLSALGALGITAGRKLTHGSRFWAVSVRKLCGIALLLFAAIAFIFYHENRHLLVAGVAALLLSAGLALLLSWRKKVEVPAE